MALLALIAAALLITACAEEQAVCPPEGEHLVIVPSISLTDHQFSVDMTPSIARQAVRRAARSCGRVTVGIQDGRPEANLELKSRSLNPNPRDRKAFNPEAFTKRLAKEGDRFVSQQLLEPLAASEPRGGSPFLTTMAKVGEEIKAQSWQSGTLVMVGDGLVVEPSPKTGKMIKLGEGATPDELEAFVPLLKRLRGSCVILVGAGAASKLSGERIRATLRALKATLKKAGVEFVAVRSPYLPRCG